MDDGNLSKAFDESVQRTFNEFCNEQIGSDDNPPAVDNQRHPTAYPSKLTIVERQRFSGDEDDASEPINIEVCNTGLDHQQEFPTSNSYSKMILHFAHPVAYQSVN